MGKTVSPHTRTFQVLFVSLCLCVFVFFVFFVFVPPCRWRKTPRLRLNFTLVLRGLEKRSIPALERRTAMAEQERTGVVTMRGNPLTLIGPALKPGHKAPEFQCVAHDLSPAPLPRPPR